MTSSVGPTVVVDNGVPARGLDLTMATCDKPKVVAREQMRATPADSRGRESPSVRGPAI